MSDASDRADLLEIGVVGKPHGLRGEVVVRLSTNVDGRLAPGVSFPTDDGELTVTAHRLHQGKPLVTFAGVTDRSGAEAIRGTVLRAEPLDEPPEEGWWVHELIGATVTEVDGTDRGVVASVEANPASDLLVLDSGALVPLDFVVSADDGAVLIDPPTGLFDL